VRNGPRPSSEELHERAREVLQAAKHFWILVALIATASVILLLILAFHAFGLPGIFVVALIVVIILILFAKILLYL
jgi:membrane protein YdbS with pleckstrin-like domain